MKSSKLKDKFSITITSIHGSKHFLLNQVIKKIAIYFCLFIVLVILLGALYISYLAKKTNEFEEEHKTLSAKNEKLFKKNLNMQNSLDKKAKEYQELEDEVSTIEERIGIRKNEDTSVNKRLEKISLTNAQQQFFLTQIPNGWVIENKGVTGNFGWRWHPILNKKEFHPGIDLRAAPGTPIHAPADGVVEFARYSNNGYGYSVVLIHNYGFKTVFAHMQRKDVVKAAQFVKKGDLLGYTGNTGLSTGPHLHYEVHFLNKLLQPMEFLSLNRKNFNQFLTKEDRVPWQSLIKALLLQFQTRQLFQQAQK